MEARPACCHSSFLLLPAVVTCSNSVAHCTSVWHAPFICSSSSSIALGILRVFMFNSPCALCHCTSRLSLPASRRASSCLLHGARGSSLVAQTIQAWSPVVPVMRQQQGLMGEHGGTLRTRSRAKLAWHVVLSRQYCVRPSTQCPSMCARGTQALTPCAKMVCHQVCCKPVTSSMHTCMGGRQQAAAPVPCKRMLARRALSGG